MFKTRTSTMVLILSLLSFATYAIAQDSEIDKRKKLMKSTSSANKAIKKAVKGMDYAAIETKAKEIADNMEKLPGLFPKGSTAENSRAKAVIWEKWDDFAGEASKVKTAAMDVATAAAAKDQTQVEQKVKAFGKACGTCHKTFRAPKKKK